MEIQPIIGLKPEIITNNIPVLENLGGSVNLLTTRHENQKMVKNVDDFNEDVQELLNKFKNFTDISESKVIDTLYTGIGELRKNLTQGCYCESIRKNLKQLFNVNSYYEQMELIRSFRTNSLQRIDSFSYKLPSLKGDNPDFFTYLIKNKFFSKAELLNYARKYDKRFNNLKKLTTEAQISLYQNLLLREYTRHEFLFNVSIPQRIVSHTVKNIHDKSIKTKKDLVNIYGVTPEELLETLSSTGFTSNITFASLDDSKRALFNLFVQTLLKSQKASLEDVNVFNNYSLLLCSLSLYLDIDELTINIIRFLQPKLIETIYNFCSYPVLLHDTEDIFFENGEFRPISVLSINLYKIFRNFLGLEDLTDTEVIEQGINFQRENSAIYTQLVNYVEKIKPELAFIAEKSFSADNKSFLVLVNTLCNIEGFKFDKTNTTISKAKQDILEHKDIYSNIILNAKNLLKVDELSDFFILTQSGINNASEDLKPKYQKLIQTLHNVDELYLAASSNLANGELEKASIKLNHLQEDFKQVEDILNNISSVFKTLTKEINDVIQEKIQNRVEHQEEDYSAIIEGLKNDIEHFKLSNKSLTEELFTAKITLNSLQESDDRSEPNQIDYISILSKPFTVSSVVEIINKKYSHVVFSDKIKNQLNDCVYENPHLLLSALDSLCGEYFDAISNGVADSVARKILGNKYKANESDSVKADKKLKAKRMFTINGNTKYMFQHLRIGNAHDPKKTVHVFFIIEKNELQIGYVGSHLPI